MLLFSVTQIINAFFLQQIYMYTALAYPHYGY